MSRSTARDATAIPMICTVVIALGFPGRSCLARNLFAFASTIPCPA